MSDLKELQSKVIKFRDDRDWKQFHNPKDCALSLVLEATEFMEHFQWKNAEQLEKYIQANREDLSDELADVFYWLLLISNDLGINLRSAVENKLEKTAMKYPVDKSRGNSKKYTEL